MSTPRILVIAPDSDLQRSLRFALEAEHYHVSWLASLGARPVPGSYDCIVLDHHALGPDLRVARSFLAAFRPVILLANEPHILSSLVFRTILKPHLGAPLIEAVRAALAQLRTATT
jgi:hypothetical protein